MDSSKKILQLTEKRNELLNRAEALVTKGLNENNREQYRKLIAESDECEQDITSLKRIARALPSLPAVAAPTPTIEIVPESSEKRRAKLNAAYRHLLRNGYRPNAPEQRDVSIASDGTVGIPQEFESAWVSAQKFYGPIATLVKSADQTTGRARKFPVSDDTASTMSYVAEDGSTSGVEEDPTLFSQIPGTTDSLVTTVLYSFQELSDAFSLESFIQNIAGIRVARAVEYALTLGKDNGTTTQLPNSPTGGLLGNVSAGVTAGSGTLAAGPTYAQLSALSGSVDHAYRVNGAYMASPSVFNFLVEQVDTTGRPLYKFDPNTGLLIVAGKPLCVNAAMQAYNTASSPIVLFGDFSRAYAYLNGGGIRIKILSERYADQMLGAAVIYHRLAAATLVSNAVKSLVTAAS